MPHQVAELSLLRALWLQREIHRASRWRQREAAALLARSSVENCILGLYCLRGERPLEALRGENAHQAARMFEYLKDANVINQAIVDCLREEVGREDVGRRLPSAEAMARLVANAADDTLTSDIYKRLYIPLSTLFTHASGLALLRHVPKQAAEIRPTYAWTKRSPARTADACVGILAAAIARDYGLTPRRFLGYAATHVRRVIPPLPAMVGRQGTASLKARLLPRMLLQLLKGYLYFRSHEGLSAPYAERTARLRRTMEEVISNFELDVSDVARACILDQLILIFAGPSSDLGDQKQNDPPAT